MFSKIALENSDNSELLLNKVIELDKSSSDISSLTSEIIEKRNSLKEEIIKELDKESSSSEDDSEEDELDTDSTDDEEDELDTDSIDDEDDSEEDELDTDSTDDEEDTNSKETDKDKDKEDTDKKENKDTNDKNVSKENLNTFYQPILDVYSKYTESLEQFSINDRLSLEEQPVVYTKEAVIKTLQNLISLLDSYISKNETFIDQYSKTSININERLTILNVYIEKNKYKFTNKLISDLDLLVKLSTTKTSSIKDNIKVINNFALDVIKIIEAIITNTFDNLLPAITSNNFIEDNKYGGYSYKEMLPGFVLIKTSIPKYEGYTKTDLEDYSYFKLKQFNTKNIYDLKPLLINDDNEIENILDYCDKVLVNISIIIDTFKTINTKNKNIITDLKNTVYDVEHNKFDKIKDIDIDFNIQTVVKFKVLSEVFIQSVTVLIEYLLTLFIVFDECLKVDNTK